VLKQRSRGSTKLICLVDGKTAKRELIWNEPAFVLLFIRVPYAALAKVFGLIEATTKRLEKTALLTAFLLLVIRRSTKGDATSLLQSVYLCINRVSSLQRATLTFDLTLH
jgi:hypothetical protein